MRQMFERATGNIETKTIEEESWTPKLSSKLSSENSKTKQNELTNIKHQMILQTIHLPSLNTQQYKNIKQTTGIAI